MLMTGAGRARQISRVTSVARERQMSQTCVSQSPLLRQICRDNAPIVPTVVRGSGSLSGLYRVSILEPNLTTSRGTVPAVGFLSASRTRGNSL